MRPTAPPRRSCRPGLALLCCSLFAQPALGQGAGGRQGAGGQQGAGAGAGGENGREPAPSDPRTARVRALLNGALDLSIEPQSLFDVALDDEGAVQIEAARVRTLLKALDDHERAARAPRRRPAARAEGPSGARAEAPDPGLFRARIELDRARSEFYALPREGRDALLLGHERRREAARPREAEEERGSREAEEERRRTREAARFARSEAERLAGDELGRLDGLQKGVASARGRFRERRAELGTRRDAVLGWQRRAVDAKAGSPAEADALYDALRRSLRASRDDLDRALDALHGGPSDVPALWPDPLADMPPDAAADRARERRTAVARERAEALNEEASLREGEASSLLETIDALNRERLGLLPHLSPEKRHALTGFTPTGVDQARSEGRQLSLIFRYHRHVIADWARSLRGGARPGATFWRAASLAVPWALLLFAFAWLRRRSPWLIVLAGQRLARADRERRGATPASPPLAVRLASSVHRPLEWLLFLAAAERLLPPGARAQLETQLLFSIARWAFGGALIVNAVNALAAGPSAPPEGGDGAGGLRLRSLRLVGRVVVSFALVLMLTARLVGEGTIYRWVLSTCWAAAVPVVLVLLRWWRGTVFDRLERSPKKTRLQAWALARRSGLQSPAAVTLGAAQLLASGATKAARGRLASFDAARRAHAYLFKRGLAKLANGDSKAEARPLRPSVFESLSPEAPFDAWVPCPADEALSRLRPCLRAGRGVVAVVGGRGLGKSSLLRKIAQAEAGSLVLDCVTHATPEALRSALDARAAAAEGPPAPPVLLDDAHALVTPAVGGFAALDGALALARSGRPAAPWVFAIDAALWPLMQRARDALPLFDDVIVLSPWTEGQLGDLLSQRSASAGVTPTYEDLLEGAPAFDDEVGRREALSERQEGYVRMLWDHVRGNPGMALEAFRSSLVEGPEGVARVRPLEAPDPARIEALPDPSLFVLRAVLQLASATPADVARATRLSEAQVVDIVRFGEAQGYLAEAEGRVRVTWRWLRAVVALLERRRLLVAP